MLALDCAFYNLYMFVIQTDELNVRVNNSESWDYTHAAQAGEYRDILHNVLSK